MSRAVFTLRIPHVQKKSRRVGLHYQQPVTEDIRLALIPRGPDRGEVDLRAMEGSEDTRRGMVIALSALRPLIEGLKETAAEAEKRGLLPMA